MGNGKKLTLLFIDDEPQLLNVFEKFYSEKGFKVIVASSGAKGLKQAATEKPDLIILDLRMPGMDGMETLKKLRTKDKTTKVIVLTGYGTAGAIRAGEDLGISDFVAKPFDLNALLGVINEVIGLKSEG